MQVSRKRIRHSRLPVVELKDKILFGTITAVTPSWSQRHNFSETSALAPAFVGKMTLLLQPYRCSVGHSRYFFPEPNTTRYSYINVGARRLAEPTKKRQANFRHQSTQSSAARNVSETQNLASLRVSTTTTNDTIIAHACGNVLFMRTQVHTKKPVKPY